MAQGRFTGETTARDGSKLEFKKTSEVGDQYWRFIPTVERLAITEEAPADPEPLESLFGGTLEVVEEASVISLTGDGEIYVNPRDPVQEILRDAHVNNTFVDMRETLKGDKANDNTITLASADSIELTASSATVPYGVIDVTGTRTAVVGLRNLVQGIGRGATLKHVHSSTTTYLFIADLKYNDQGGIDELHVSRGAGRTDEWDGSAISDLQGAIDVYNTEDVVRLYNRCRVSVMPLSTFESGATGGYQTAPFQITMAQYPVVTVSDPS